MAQLVGETVYPALLPVFTGAGLTGIYTRTVSAYLTVRTVVTSTRCYLWETNMGGISGTGGDFYAFVGRRTLHLRTWLTQHTALRLVAYLVGITQSCSLVSGTVAVVIYPVTRLTRRLDTSNAYQTTVYALVTAGFTGSHIGSAGTANVRIPCYLVGLVH